MLTISKTAVSQQGANLPCAGVCLAGTETTGAGSAGHSEWQGRLAEHWGLQVALVPNTLPRLSEGQHPHTEEQLVRHQVSRTYEGKFGREVTSAEHRAGWDATFSAPKSFAYRSRGRR